MNGRTDQHLDIATSLCVRRSRKDGPRVDARRPEDPERLRAVGAPARFLDAGDLRLRTPNRTNINMGARRPNNPRFGEGRGRVGRHGRGLHQRSFVGRRSAGLGTGVGHARLFTGPNEAFPCQTGLSSRWTTQRKQFTAAPNPSRPQC